MIVHKLPNTAGSVLIVTSTAQTLSELITTAASTKFVIEGELNAVDLFIEVNNVRFLDDGNIPTSTQGHLLRSGDTLSIRGMNIDKIQLIRAGSNDATVTVRLGEVTSR